MIINKTHKKVYFEIIVPSIDSNEQLQKRIEQVQESLGYFVAGYGSPLSMGVQVLNDGGGYRITWQCAASCD